MRPRSFTLKTRIRNLELLQLRFEEDQCQARENLPRAKSAWESGTVTTGRGFLDSVCRTITELEDARYRESVAQSKRRQIEELTALQGRSFTHAQEVGDSRIRLDAVMSELERSTNAPKNNAEQPGLEEQGIDLADVRIMYSSPFFF